MIRRIRASGMVAMVLSTTALAPFAWCQNPVFDVASIKRSSPGEQAVLSHFPGGRFTAEKATLKILIAYAWDVPRPEVVDGPAWLDTDRFDIVAKPDSAAESATPVDDAENLRRIRLMLRQLLISRFSAEIGPQRRDVAVYKLTVSKTGPSKSLVMNDGTKPHGIVNRSFASIRSLGEIRFGFQKVGMDEFAAHLFGTVAQEDLGRPVVNETNLPGEYDFTLTWLPFANSSQPGATGPSLFTAVQEQLGLKLEAGRGTVTVLVVARAEHPSDN